MGAPGGENTSEWAVAQVVLSRFLQMLRGQVRFMLVSMDEAELNEQAERVIRAAFNEDIGTGDATTLAVVPPDREAHAKVVVREVLVVAGIQFAEQVFKRLCPDMETQVRVKDGHTAQPGEVLMSIHGLAQPILTAERTALNLLQRLSGIATLTREFIQKMEGTSARLLDTRKTTPGLRYLEKYAVKCGGGENHRVGLWDMILIKDNHLAALSTFETPVQEAIRRARQRYPALKVEVEADTLEQAREAAENGADIILLDNMKPADLRKAVEMIAGRSKTEASGGVNLATIRAIAETGVDFISVGAITHSAKAVDIALDFEL